MVPEWFVGVGCGVRIYYGARNTELGVGFLVQEMVQRFKDAVVCLVCPCYLTAHDSHTVRQPTCVKIAQV